LKTSQYEINFKHGNVTVSTHIIYNYILIAMAQKHFTASKILYLQKLRIVGIVGYHLRVPNFKIFSTLPKFWVVGIYPNVYDIGYASLNEPRLICPAGSNCTQV